MTIYNNNLSTFFDDITLSLNNAASKFENFIMSEFNIDVNSFGPGMDELVGMTNLVKKATFYK